MASISTDKKGLRRILFIDANGDRQKIHIGRTPKKAARTICAHIEAIVLAQQSRTAMDSDTVAWMDGITDKLAKKLARVGLMQPREPVPTASAETISAFIDRYIGLRSDVKLNTVKTWKQTRALLAEHFGEGHQLDAVTGLDAIGFHSWLTSLKREETPIKRFSGASVMKYTALSRQIFSAAVDDRIISANPFEGIKLGKKTNKSRQRFIDRATIQRAFDGCADKEFKLVVALSRYGGLRIPSELNGLRWQDIDRARGRILITSPKTERYEGGASREIPLYPELVPFIDAWHDACSEGHEYVIVSNRDTEAAWRTRLTKLLKRLGIPAWPKIFHNLRASRQTELEECFPSHVVCRWMGNSETVARDHYLQTTEEHFLAGSTMATESPSEKAARKAARKTPEGEGKARNRNIRNAEDPAKRGVFHTSTGADGNRTHLAPLQTPHRV